MPTATRVDWAAVFRSEYRDTVGWASTFAGPSAEDLVSEAFYIAVAEDWQPVQNPIGWLRSKVRQLWVTRSNRERLARERLMRYARDLDPEDAHYETFLVPPSRILSSEKRLKRRAYERTIRKPLTEKQRESHRRRNRELRERKKTA